jgi:hypothetical protein
MATLYNPSISKENLQICLDWGNPRCYSGSGTTFNNLINPSINNGYLKNNVTYNSANSGYVLTGGANNGQANNVGDRIDINTSAAGIDRFNKTHNFSIFFWNYLISNNTNKIFSTGSAGALTGNNDACIWQMWMASDMFYWWDSTGGGTNNIICTFASSRVLNTWQYVGVTYSYNEGGNNVARTYVNGQLVATASVATATHSAIDRSAETSLQWTLGGGYNGGCFNNNSQNRFGSFHLYNKTLSNAEILKNYNATKGRYGL